MLGKAMAEFRRMTGDVRRVVEDEMREIERQTRENEARRQQAVAAQPQILPPPGETSQALPPADGSEGAESAAPAGKVPADRPATGKAETLSMQPAADEEIEQDLSHVKHNPS